MKNSIKEAFKNILSDLNYPLVDIKILLPKNKNHGDFSTNLAMQLSSKTDKDPKKIANDLIKILINNYSNLITSAEIAGPGFINIFINKNVIIDKLYTIIKENKKFGFSNSGSGQTALVEFVSANPTGPLTVGHGRGAISGDVIANILIWNGYKVHREYYYNNAGKQMERLGESVKARYYQKLGEKYDLPENGYEGNYIIDIAHNLVNEKGNSLIASKNIKPFIQAAEKNIFKHIKSTLDRMKLDFDSFFNENTLYETGAIDEIVNSLESKNLVYKKDGATWFKATEAGREQDRVIIKSSGEPTYRLPDIAYHVNKYKRGYDLIIDVLGADHMDAYPDVIAAIDQLGFEKTKMKVIIHQFVTLTENSQPVKMSTRKANYVTLDELINEVGVDVVRYFFIMRSMNTHLNFDLAIAKDESDENPVYYLQYAHARLSNILKHAESQGYHIDQNIDLSPLTLDEEVNLIKVLFEFKTIVQKTLLTLEPQNIANYLNNLATLFHKYYAKERVVTDNSKLTKSRLILIKAIKIVISNGLDILGIEAPDRM